MQWNGEEELRWLAGIAGAIMAIWALVKTVFQPCLRQWRKYRTKHPSSITQILHKLEEMTDLQRQTADWQTRYADQYAASLRQQIAQSHTYYLDAGYCTNLEKSLFCQLMQVYQDNGWNNMQQSWLTEIMALPEHPHARKESEV